MCLLISKKADSHFDYNDIQDFWSFNKDGLGIMFVENREVVVKKILPTTADEAWEFYKEYADNRECALHFRMRTHGVIDASQSHPYEVLPGIWLMHNGVLHTGNNEDKTRSDTDLYCQNYLRPMLEANPSFLHTKAFHDVIRSHIGHSNRFVILSPDGTVSINMDQGVEYKGCTMSNTYAWSSPRTNFMPTTYTPTYSKTQQSWAGWGYDEFDLDDPVGGDDWTDAALEYFWETLDCAGLWGAYNALRLTDIEAAMIKVGEDAFYEFCDLIYDANLKDEDVEAFIYNPQDWLTEEVAA